jgi:hypothetical protein
VKYVSIFNVQISKEIALTKDELLRKMEETEKKREEDRLASEKKSLELQKTMQTMAASIDTLSQQVKQLLTQSSKVPDSKPGFFLDLNFHSHLVIGNGMQVDDKHSENPIAQRKGL